MLTNAMLNGKHIFHKRRHFQEDLISNQDIENDRKPGLILLIPTKVIQFMTKLMSLLGDYHDLMH